MNYAARKSLLFFSLFALLSFSAIGQVPVKWEQELTADINWQQVTTLGKLIVSTQDGLKSIDTESGTPSWSITELANLTPEQFTELPDSPFFKVNDGDNFSLIDQFSGDIVFDSRRTDADYIQNYFLLYEQGGILVAGNSKNGEPVLFFVTMSDAAVQWTISEKFGRIVAVNELEGDELLIVTLFENYRVNAKTGEIIWKVANSREVEQLDKMGNFGNFLKDMAEGAMSEDEVNVQFYRKPNSEEFYLAIDSPKLDFDDKPTGKYEGSVYAYNLGDGSRVWDEPLDFSGRVKYLLFQENGFLMIPEKADLPLINLYDYATKVGQWGKRGRGLSTRAQVYSYLKTDGGLILAAGGGERSFIIYLDPTTGNTYYEKPAKVSGEMTGALTTNQSVFLLMNEGLNMVNLQSGELKWKKNLKTRAALTAERDGKVYFFDTKDEMLKVLDLQTEEVSNLAADELEFEGKEDPQNMEMRENGILLFADQNMAMYDLTGKLLFNNYYPAPRDPAWLQALNYAAAAYAGLVAVESYYNAAILTGVQQELGPGNTLGKSLGKAGEAYEDNADVASDYFANAVTTTSARRKATTTGQDYNFVMTKDGKDIYLLQLNKNTGETTGQIPLGRDRRPEYAVDFVTHQVYYQKNDDTLVSFQAQ